MNVSISKFELDKSEIYSTKVEYNKVGIVETLKKSCKNALSK